MLQKILPSCPNSTDTARFSDRSASPFFPFRTWTRKLRAATQETAARHYSTYFSHSTCSTSIVPAIPRPWLAFSDSSAIFQIPTLPIPFLTARLGLIFALGPSPCSPIYISNLCCRLVNLISASRTTFQFAAPRPPPFSLSTILHCFDSTDLVRPASLKPPLRDPTPGSSTRPFLMDIGG